jgi:hypothetical protein
LDLFISKFHYNHRFARNDETNQDQTDVTNRDFTLISIALPCYNERELALDPRANSMSS